ncbi:tetratricopeptide repeat protein 12-like [Littorina saxatilis]|uniref:Tetratricopeptide repeat protein 12 n=1 Tax=Littorina saxatilis TaxID=31220 RepID=A0AAN9ATU9_9CAEN
MAANPTKDVEAFLNKVEEIETIVKGLNSGDECRLKDAMQKADDFIKSQKTKGEKDEEKDLPETKTGFSKTMINKNSSAEEGAAGGGNMAAADQNAFMAAFEADAKERCERRKISEKEAQVIKEMGNLAFKEKDFEKALEYYNQAIDKVRDNAMLYTNRAQTLIKLGKYEDALKDCDWALRANPNSIKAYVHIGRAHVALKQYQQARDSYNKVLTVDPKKDSLVHEYLGEVDRAEAASSAEEKAKEMFDAGDTEAQSLVHVLEKLKKPDQVPMYYSGGFRVLASIMTTEENQTQFRVNGGLHLLQTHNVLSRCLSASPQSITKEERDVMTSAFDMMTQACKNSDVNQEQLLKQEGLPHSLLHMLSACVKGQAKAMKTAILTLLYTISQSHHGRSVILQNVDVHRLVSTLFDLIRTNKTYAENAASVLNNLSLEKKFRGTMREKVEEILPSFEELLKDAGSKSAVVSMCISTMMNLANDKIVRTNLACRRSLWLASEELLVRTSTSTDKELLESVLGLLVNITAEPTATLREFGQRMCGHCRSLLPSEASGESIPQRALTVMGNILPHSVPAVEWICDHGGTVLLLGYMESDKPALVKHSLKCLTALTQFNETARKTVVENKGIPALAQLLNTKDEGNVGNAALCLSHCTQVAGVCSWLAQTDIVKATLIWARDGKKSAVQQNCAILLAKLAQGDPKNLERLRELHGIQILHDCMKHIR